MKLESHNFVILNEIIERNTINGRLLANLTLEPLPEYSDS